MLVVLRQNWLLIDTSDPEYPHYRLVPAGAYEVERIPSPYGDDPRGDGVGTPWLVCKDEPTLGGSERSWRRWERMPGEDRITIIEGVGLDEWVEAALAAAKIALAEPRVDPEADLAPHSYAAYLVLRDGGTDEEARKAALSV